MRTHIVSQPVSSTVFSQTIKAKSRQQLDKWYFNVKTWKLEAVNLTLAGLPVAPLTQYIRSGAFDLYATLGVEYANELEMAYKGKLVAGLYDKSSANTGVLSEAVSGADITRVFIEIIDTYKPYDTGSYVYVSFNADGSEYSWRATMSLALNAYIGANFGQLYSSPGGGGLSSARLDFDGVSNELYENTSGQPFGGYISVTPSEFWEHRDSEGKNPIYNAATGVQLIPTLLEDGSKNPLFFSR